jgi:hypothetical protein
MCLYFTKTSSTQKPYSKNTLETILKAKIVKNKIVKFKYKKGQIVKHDNNKQICPC